MKEVIIQLAKDFPQTKFYIISKTLTLPENEDDLREIIKQPNIYVNLSFHRYNKDDVYRFETLHKKYPNLRFAYTLDEFEGIKIWKAKYDEKGNLIKGAEIDVSDYAKKVIEKRIKDTLKRRAEMERIKREEPEKYKAMKPKFEKKEKKIGKKEEIDFLKGKVNLVVEMTPEYMDYLKMFDVIFNVNKGKAFRLGYYKSKLAFCECDMKMIHEYRACVLACHRCYSANLANAVRMSVPVSESSFGSSIRQTLSAKSKRNSEIIILVMEEVNIDKLKRKKCNCKE